MLGGLLGTLTNSTVLAESYADPYVPQDSILGEYYESSSARGLLGGQLVGDILAGTLAANAMGGSFKPLKPQLNSPFGTAAGVKPEVASPKLQNIVDDLYKGTNNPGRVGDGTTMDAVRFELGTGQSVFGRTHLDKAEDYLRGLQNWLKANPEAPLSDRIAAHRLMNDLLDALGRTP